MGVQLALVTHLEVDVLLLAAGGAVEKQEEQGDERSHGYGQREAQQGEALRSEP